MAGSAWVMGLTSWRAALTSRCWGFVDVMAGGADAIEVVTCEFFLAGGSAGAIFGFGAFDAILLGVFPMGGRSEWIRLSEDPDLGAEGEG